MKIIVGIFVILVCHVIDFLVVNDIKDKLQHLLGAYIAFSAMIIIIISGLLTVRDSFFNGMPPDFDNAEDAEAATEAANNGIVDLDLEDQSVAVNQHNDVKATVEAAAEDTNVDPRSS